MVLYDPMEQPTLQLVMSHPATDKKLFPRRAPSWAGDISNLSDAQLRSVHAFTQFAINNLRGETGTVSMNGNEVSQTAEIVATEYPHTGTGAFGGMSQQERRQRQQRLAERTEEQLRQEIENRGISTGGVAGGSRQRTEEIPRLETDGGRPVEQE